MWSLPYLPHIFGSVLLYLAGGCHSDNSVNCGGCFAQGKGEKTKRIGQPPWLSLTLYCKNARINTLLE